MTVSPKVIIVDYGMGNVLSVQRAFEHCGAITAISSTPSEIERASFLVLPGVGAFGDGMYELKKRELVQPIKEFCDKGKPFLGICLGMQMMLDCSEEFGNYIGLGLIPGKVIKIPATTIMGEYQKVPHVGWSRLKAVTNRVGVKTTILSIDTEKAYMYFVHSFTAVPLLQSHRLADTLYGGHALAAIINKDNLFGCQFHPEKSGACGLNLISNFLRV